MPDEDLLSRTQPENRYPTFVGGQTLTTADLNGLRDFLHDRDRLLGRLIGFGVSCGLGGTVDGSRLTIGPGLAIDQRGEPLLLPDERPVDLGNAELDRSTFDFIERRSGGVTVVLEAIDGPPTPTDCTEDLCDGHAELRAREAVLRIVPGRLTERRFDVTSEPLLNARPIRLSVHSEPIDGYEHLLSLLVERLTNDGRPLIAPALIRALAAVSIGSRDLPGIKGYKVGFINQVLFATLDLLRCMALMTASCDRTATRPGVALGWAHQVGRTWVWECAHSHVWEPPMGVVQALLGRSCSGLLGPYVDALEGLVSGYAPPDPRAPSRSTNPTYVYRPDGMDPEGRVSIYFPPAVIEPRAVTDFYVRDGNPGPPIWNPGTTLERLDAIVRNVYRTLPWEYLGTGVLTVLDALGRSVESAALGLEGAIGGLGAESHVISGPAQVVAAMAGYAPAGSINLADTVVLTVDAQDVVVAIGRVPAAHTARTVGGDVSRAITRAEAAFEAAAQQKVELTALLEQITGLDRRLSEVNETVTAIGPEIAKVAPALAVIDAIDGKIISATEQRLGDLRDRVASVEGSLKVLPWTRPDGSTTTAAQFDKGFAGGMAEFAQTVNAGLTTLVTDDNKATLGRHVRDAARATAALEIAAAGGSPMEIRDAAITVLGTMRTAVKSAGIDPALANELDTQFRAVKGLLG